MESPGFKDRRLFARFPVKVLLRYLNLDLPGEAHTYTRDVSAKGICLMTSEALSAETPLDMWLQMPDSGEQVYIKGKVVWSNMIKPNKYKVGVNLENIELNPILLALKAIQFRIKNH